jgi:hypothetical protein
MITPNTFGELDNVEQIVPDEQPRMLQNVTLTGASLIYLFFTFLLFWPVLWGKRFFWEDFFAWEYPIRDYCYYMLGLRHTLPFWNPYNWNLPAVLADGQNGFWYPANMLGILLTRLFAPAQTHLPIVVPELLTIIHYPLAALGIFYLLKNHFRLAGRVALLAGFTYGFGSRIISDQNHAMWVFQLALLPWATLLLLRSWNFWRSSIGLGMVLGIGFLAGHPQVFLFTSFFFFCYTLAEVWTRRKEYGFTKACLRPFASLAFAMIIASGIASIQLLPSLELAGMSARSQLNYYFASRFSIHPLGLLVFFTPKLFPEAGDIPSMHQPMQAIFYWSLLGEIFALFALTVLWNYRRDLHNPITRHLRFVIIFSIFALAFALGPNLPVQWLFWKFVPFFNQVRSPARMLWFFWLLGTIFGGIGIQLFLTRRPEAIRYRKLFLGISILSLTVNIIATCGAVDFLLFPGHFIRPGIQMLLLPSLIMSVLVLVFFILSLREKLPWRFLFPIIASLILLDLFFNDVTQQRNTVSRDSITAADISNPEMQKFFHDHPNDHAKLVWLRNNASFGIHENLSMILRLPIEDAMDSDGLLAINPMRFVRPLPPTPDSQARMQIMGAAGLLKNGSSLVEYSNVLPFLKLYTDWRIAPNDSVASGIYADSNFDFHHTLLVNSSPGFVTTTWISGDTAILTRFSENELAITTQSSRSALLLVNDLYYPAWRAYVDGSPVTISRAFTSLRAVPVPPGRHRVEMKYQSTAFDLGWKITLGTLIISILALFIGKKQKNPEITRGSSI